MGFSEAIKSVFSQYATFTGRASRSEYWYFTLFNLIVYIGSIILSAVIPLILMLYMVFSIAVIIPGIAVGVRRLHDIGKSGWWYLIVFIPLIGMVILLIWFVMSGTVGPNEYGEDTLETEDNSSGPKIV